VTPRRGPLCGYSDARGAGWAAVPERGHAAASQHPRPAHSLRLLHIRHALACGGEDSLCRWGTAPCVQSARGRCGRRRPDGSNGRILQPCRSDLVSPPSGAPHRRDCLVAGGMYSNGGTSSGRTSPSPWGVGISPRDQTRPLYSSGGTTQGQSTIPRGHAGKALPRRRRTVSTARITHSGFVPSRQASASGWKRMRAASL
jgi:hypothetical protein